MSAVDFREEGKALVTLIRPWSCQQYICTVSFIHSLKLSFFYFKNISYVTWLLVQWQLCNHLWNPNENRNIEQSLSNWKKKNSKIFHLQMYLMVCVGSGSNGWAIRICCYSLFLSLWDKDPVPCSTRGKAYEVRFSENPSWKNLPFLEEIGESFHLWNHLQNYMKWKQK